MVCNFFWQVEFFFWWIEIINFFLFGRRIFSYGPKISPRGSNFFSRKCSFLVGQVFCIVVQELFDLCHIFSSGSNCFSSGVKHLTSFLLVTDIVLNLLHTSLTTKKRICSSKFVWWLHSFLVPPSLISVYGCLLSKNRVSFKTQLLLNEKETF